MKRIRQSLTCLAASAFFVAVCANRADAQDAMTAVVSGVGSGIFLCFCIGYALMHWEAP